MTQTYFTSIHPESFPAWAASKNGNGIYASGPAFTSGIDPSIDLSKEKDISKVEICIGNPQYKTDKGVFEPVNFNITTTDKDITFYDNEKKVWINNPSYFQVYYNDKTESIIIESNEIPRNAGILKIKFNYKFHDETNSTKSRKSVRFYINIALGSFKKTDAEPSVANVATESNKNDPSQPLQNPLAKYDSVRKNPEISHTFLPQNTDTHKITDKGKHSLNLPDPSLINPDTTSTPILDTSRRWANGSKPLVSTLKLQIATDNLKIFWRLLFVCLIPIAIWKRQWLKSKVENFLKNLKIQSFRNAQMTATDQVRVTADEEILAPTPSISFTFTNSVSLTLTSPATNSGTIDPVPNIVIKSQNQKAYLGSKRVQEGSYEVVGTDWCFNFYDSGRWPNANVARLIMSQGMLEMLMTYTQESILRDTKEVGWFLLGKVYQGTSKGYDVVITDYVEIDPEYNDTYQLSFGPRTWSRVEDACKADANLVVIGWFHTHPGHHVFLSDFDLKLHEKDFPQPWTVAVVVDPLREGMPLGAFCWLKPEDSSKTATISNVIGIPKDSKDFEDKITYLQPQKRNLARLSPLKPSIT